MMKIAWKACLAAAGALMIAAPALAARGGRVPAGGDPNLDLTVNPGKDRSDAAPAPAVDDHVYLPGLTERPGAESVSQYQGMGGPIEDEGDYRPCSATRTDRCIEVGGLK